MPVSPLDHLLDNLLEPAAYPQPSGPITRRWWRLGWLSAVAVMKANLTAVEWTPAAQAEIDRIQAQGSGSMGTVMAIQNSSARIAILRKVAESYHVNERHDPDFDDCTDEVCAEALRAMEVR